MANKPIPISLASASTKSRRNYSVPKKGSDRKHGLVVDAKIPGAPKDAYRRNVLGVEGMREWRRITRLLSNAKVIAEIDRAVLTQYCLLWELMITDRQNFKAAQHTQLRLCAVELGLTPSARSRLRG